MAQTARVKLFVNGGSQAVRLPKDMRFQGSEVIAEKLDDGVLLRPLPADDWGWIEELAELGPFSDDFVAAVNDKPEMPDMKPEVAAFFGVKDT